MATDYQSETTARYVLETYRVVAVVGLSPTPDRPSHRVAALLQSRGYRIVPIHPAAAEILGEKAYPSLADVPPDIGVEVVDVFRKPEFAEAHAREAVSIGAKALWLQDGVVSEAAAAIADEAGLRVVMDRCMARDLATFAT
jgi:predicted CoA-binding protein